jgi:serine/threonine protein phosphatase PrpC
MNSSTTGGVDVQIAVLSKVGGRDRNEDACGYWSNGGPLCCVLSDGAGGHGGGDLASRVAVETILRAFQANPASNTATDVLDLMTLANREVMREQSRDDSVSDMHATLVLLIIDPAGAHAMWGHVGDSRLYWFRSGYVAAQTKDHSLVQSMIDAGFAPAEEVRQNPERSVLIASLGGDDGFAPVVTERPQPLRAGDAFLLCSDGFWEYVTEQAMEAALQRVATPQDWLDSLELIVQSTGRPGMDNYSAVAVWFGDMDFTTMTPVRAD